MGVSGWLQEEDGRMEGRFCNSLSWCWRGEAVFRAFSFSFLSSNQPASSIERETVSELESEQKEREVDARLVGWLAATTQARPAINR